jgi:hypothetical protein
VLERSYRVEEPEPPTVEDVHDDLSDTRYTVTM